MDLKLLLALLKSSSTLAPGYWPEFANSSTSKHLCEPSKAWPPNPASETSLTDLLARITKHVMLDANLYFLILLSALQCGVWRTKIRHTEQHGLARDKGDYWPIEMVWKRLHCMAEEIHEYSAGHRKWWGMGKRMALYVAEERCTMWNKDGIFLTVNGVC